jgi:hypothetical protein
MERNPTLGLFSDGPSSTPGAFGQSLGRHGYIVRVHEESQGGTIMSYPMFLYIVWTECAEALEVCKLPR